MKKFLLSTTIMLLFAITLSAQTTITLGEKITTTEEIKSTAQKWLNNPKLDDTIREQLTAALNSEELLKNYF